jgi:hypothetical protein
LVVDAVKRHQTTMISIVEFCSTVRRREPSGAQVHSRQPVFLPSIVDAIAIAESLAAAMLAKGGKSAAARVKRVENELIAQGAYLNARGSD